MTEHVRIGERTFPYLPPADPPTLRKHPIGSTEAVFESGEVGIALNTIPRLVLEIPYDRTCPYRETDFRPCSHSSFNLGCEPKSEKCILSYGHVFSIGTSHTNLVMVFGAIPGSSDLKTGLLRLFSYFFLF